ncbi:hypothetical protein CUMW_129390 [Citrus unshiu]|nr:hypothetical protein CUMW_129390 [Citrus unshiu]
MKFYISTTGIKRVTISNSGTGKRSSAPAAALAGRRIPSSRTLLPVVLVLGIVLPFLFVRVAFLVLESSAVCSSSLGCIGRRIFSGSDTSLVATFYFNDEYTLSHMMFPISIFHILQ